MIINGNAAAVAITTLGSLSYNSHCYPLPDNEIESVSNYNY